MALRTNRLPWRNIPLTNAPMFTPDIIVTLVSSSGFHISLEYHHYLGASPDGAVYDPSNMQQSFGFVEIKCPYSSSSQTPAETNTPGFCCNFVRQVEFSSLKKIISIMHKYKGRWPQVSVRGATLLFTQTKV